MTNNQSPVDVWVPIVGAGTEDDHHRPDVPAGVAWKCNEGIPCELDPVSGRRGHPVGAHALVTVDAKDVSKITSAVPPAQVPGEMRLLVELCRSVERDGASRMTPAAEERIRAVFRGRRGADKPMLGRLLVHMVRRGLSPTTAQQVAAEADLA